MAVKQGSRKLNYGLEPRGGPTTRIFSIVVLHLLLVHVHEGWSRSVIYSYNLVNYCSSIYLLIYSADLT
jgi:hypothetical protein